ncbi:MAG: hypothetical protein JNL01_06280 [Bdellovibrionales bacterium]|nr:hypothetical protein [Bdellovibrionales bacterium]
MTTESSPSLSNQVTVVVMKDHLAARTFQIPLAWVGRLGLILGVLIATTVVSLGVAVRNYWIARKSDPLRLMELESEIQDLQNKINLLQTSGGQVVKTVTEAPAAQATAQATSAAAATEAPTATAVPTPAESVKSDALFGGDLVISPDPKISMPFRIESARAQWKGTKLETVFHFIYTKTDGQSQKGRFLILARGPKKIAAFPENAIQVSGQSVQLRAGEGEYFSVGKFREAVAEFDRLGDVTDITTVEVLIYDRNQKLLQQFRLTPTVSNAQGKRPQQKRKSSAPSPTATSAPATTTTPAADGAAAAATAAPTAAPATTAPETKETTSP